MKRLLSAAQEHGPRALIFLAGSALAQGTAAISGLLLARWLPVPDYALYTVFVSLTSTVLVLSKGGINAGYVAILGRVWPDMFRAAQALAAALKLRRMVSVFALPAVLVFAAVMLAKNDADLLLLVILLLLVAVAWLADMQTRLLDQILFFANQTTRIQMIDSAFAAVRLAGIVGLYMAGWLALIPAIILGLIGPLLRIWPMLKWAYAQLGIRNAPTRYEDVQEIKTAVYRQLPVELYIVLQAQIVIMVLSFYGSIADVASFGAITRLNQLLVPVHLFTVAFSVPAFAKAKSNLTRLLLGLVALTLIPGLFLTILAALRPSVLLWLIGPNYYHLHHVVLIAVSLATLLRSATALRTLVTNRGWVRFSWIQMPIGLSWLAISPFVLDLSTLEGALLLQAGFACAIALSSIVDFASRGSIVHPGQK